MVHGVNQSLLSGCEHVCRILGVEIEVHSILGFVDNEASKNAKAISLLSKSGGDGHY
jgi:hypothetical protein